MSGSEMFTLIQGCADGKGPHVLKLGGDCAGYNTAGISLELLGVKYVDVFASDTNAKVRAVLTKNFKGLKDFGISLGKPPRHSS